MPFILQAHPLLSSPHLPQSNYTSQQAFSHMSSFQKLLALLLPHYIHEAFQHPWIESYEDPLRIHFDFLHYQIGRLFHRIHMQIHPCLRLLYLLVIIQQDPFGSILTKRDSLYHPLGLELKGLFHHLLLILFPTNLYFKFKN